MSKKLMVFAMIVAVAAFLAVSNASAAMTYEVGAKGGINLGKMWGSDADSLGTDTSMRVGFLGGAFFTANFSDVFGARLEVDYAQRGEKIKDPSGDLTLKLDYVEIALYGVGTYAVNDQFSIYGLAGPYVGFRSKAEISDGATVDIKDQTKSTDFGIGVGAGFGYAASEMLKIFVEGQYNIGFMSVDDSGADLTIKNQGIGITAGVAIPLGGSSGGSSGGM